MEKLGRQMIIQCECLPLAIIVVGGILATKTSLQEWKKVNENIQWYMKNGEGIGQQNKGKAMEVLSSSYDELPYQLKPCFLYLAKFPEDSEIEAERLYHFWMAESMVLAEDQKEGECMMDVAEHYLDELCHERCMVQVQLEENHEYGPRKFKFCRLHDLTKFFCSYKAKEEDFISIVEFQPRIDKRVESLSNKTRRVFIFCDGEDTNGRNISFTNEVSQNLRSMLFFSGGFYKGHFHSVVASIIKNFRFLRVLVIEGLDFDDAVVRSEMESSKLFFDVIAFAKAIYRQPNPFEILEFEKN